MKAFVYEIRFLPGTEQEYLLERVTHAGERHVLPYAPDDVNWMTLLSRQLSFRFVGRFGSLSVYLERSRSKDPKRGDQPYWSGYRKAHGVQVKTYLGQDLSTQKLEQASASLWACLRRIRFSRRASSRTRGENRSLLIISSLSLRRKIRQ